MDEQTAARQPSERRRVIRSAGIGALIAFALAWFVPWQMVVLAGFLVASSVLLLWIWLAVGWLDAASTKILATREDDSRAAPTLL